MKLMSCSALSFFPPCVCLCVPSIISSFSCCHEKLDHTLSHLLYWVTLAKRDIHHLEGPIGRFEKWHLPHAHFLVTAQLHISCFINADTKRSIHLLAQGTKYHGGDVWQETSSRISGLCSSLGVREYIAAVYGCPCMASYHKSYLIQ